jgi:TonB family protein
MHWCTTAVLSFSVCASAWTQSPDAPATPAPSRPEYKLEAILTENAVYPPQAREAKVEGEIVAFFAVSDTGVVKNVRVYKGDPALAKAAENAVAKWKFKPVVKGDKAIQVLAKATFNFVLNEGAQTTSGVAAEIGPATEAPTRVRVSNGVSAGLVVTKVHPTYPADAKRAGIQGVVLLHAVIGRDGTISDLQPISGPEELIPSAMAAVKQWRYKPYTLNGIPVEVDTQVQINFTLSR